VKNKIVREIIDFVRGHQLLFDQVLRQDISAGDELTIEQINLVVGILSKVMTFFMYCAVDSLMHSSSFIESYMDFR